MAEENAGQSGAAAKVETKLAQAAAEGSISNFIDQKVQANPADAPKGDVTAVTIARMMGLATSTELRLLEGKVDLMSSRLTSLTMRAEKILTMLQSTPTGSDLERIDVQIGSLRTMLRDSMAKIIGEAAATATAEASAPNAPAAEKKE